MITNNYYLLKLLSNHNVTFFIPPYQRNYEWGEEMWEILYKDIEKIANNIDLEHFFGTVIYYAESGQILGQPETYILIDGQQRLTTAMLFLIAIRDRLTDDNLKNYIDSEYLKNKNVSGGGDNTEYKIKLKQVEKDWEAYKKIILGEDLEDVDKKSNVFKSYKFFKSKLEKLEQNKVEDLVNKGLMKFNIVTIQLEPEKNSWEKPQEIFESMNSLGKPLSLADLVRNYLFLGKSSDKQNSLYHSYWLKIEKNLSGDDNVFSTSAFIRDYMQLIDATSYKKATDTNHKELYREFKDLFESEDSENMIKDLASYSKEYGILAGYKSSGNSQIDLKIEDIKKIKSSGFYSFILGLLYLRAEKKLDDNDTLAILDAIFIYTFRRRILKLTQGENKDIPLLVKYFEDLIFSKDKRAKMLEILSSQQHALRLPNDNEIKDLLLSEKSNFYNFDSGKFLLSLIEENLTKSRPVIEKNLQCEHIMPQTLNEAWKGSLGQNHKDIHDNYLNNIGNLTLIRHNGELGNSAFSNKKEIYANNAGMQIAKDKIVTEQNWGEGQIRARAKYLVEILTEKVLPLSDLLKTSNNYSAEKRSSRNKLSFKSLGLIGKTITYFDDTNIVAEVLDEKLLKFENTTWRLSPLTRIIETKKERRNSSGAYWGVEHWTYEGKTLKELMSQIKNDEDEFDEDEFDENELE